MQFTALALKGVWVIEPIVHADSRGSFRRHFCADEYAEHGLAPVVAQGNVSENTEPNTTLHYYMSERFVPDSYRGIRYNDPAFRFRWPAEPIVISDRDRTHPDFALSLLD